MARVLSGSFVAQSVDPSFVRMVLGWFEARERGYLLFLPLGTTVGAADPWRGYA